MDEPFHGEYERRQAFDRFKEEAVRVICKEKRDAPRRIVAAAVEFLWPITSASDLLPTVEQVEAILKEMRSTFFLRWGISKHSASQRKDIVFGPRSKVERYLEARATNLVAKGRGLSVKQLANEAEHYYGIPGIVTVPLVERVVRRVRMRARRFRSEKSWMQMLRRYDIPVAAFLDLSKKGVITPRTEKETFRVLGKVFQNYLKEGKLKLF